MDFDLSEEQRLLEQSIDSFFADSFPLSRVRDCYDREMGSLDDLGALGLNEMLIPAQYGGGGGTILDVAVAAERLGAAAAPGPFLGRVLAGYAITVAGSEEQRARWLPLLAAGERRATIAVAEPGDRWGLDVVEMSGERLVGEKRSVLVGDGVDLAVVVLADGLAVVEFGADGLTVQDTDVLDRTRPMVSLTFDGPEHERLAGGVEAAQRVLDLGAVLLAADAHGGAAKCLDLAVQYSQVREQFGTTIAHFQVIQHQLADIAIDVLPSRGMYWYAAHAMDRVHDDASGFASLAKAHITERYIAAARRAVEVHGGIGYTWENDLHFFLRRAVFDRAYLGSPEMHRQRRAERQLAEAN
ncbi:acyl-CoA dehydrogenase family protein [Dactylosporangium sp. AC04546]|uniref:acyl-CoA dehydrogenase family protein n=1 Tax=Dactylosporangium sp. AC04546 TaxID=2862460 RepID=UPI001EDDC230|nr:acyl-CoA dehydrogenase family protein [Dactylosporangium sp. AC04546]WVK86931.1 acyl-CoA dehydrogenase family protein [Dactylosporangium sp. AC04546]